MGEVSRIILAVIVIAVIVIALAGFYIVFWVQTHPEQAEKMGVKLK